MSYEVLGEVSKYVCYVQEVEVLGEVSKYVCYVQEVAVNWRIPRKIPKDYQAG